MLGRVHNIIIVYKFFTSENFILAQYSLSFFDKYFFRLKSKINILYIPLGIQSKLNFNVLLSCLINAIIESNKKEPVYLFTIISLDKLIFSTLTIFIIFISIPLTTRNMCFYT